ncbi:hypothetical protein [Salipaludibacillus daqingensis]|uniref:hypothetical protein n=1 Tax=Salipaludibacillus daqingensis TaxID=3041001 RepID=UPI002474ADA3|nr:hypothetical protein [Salipaludibacillus daqingensis]
MQNKKLSNMTCGEFQEKLVHLVMEKIETKEDSVSSLVYFPIVHERVEAFLFAHWEKAWHDCNYLTFEEWLTSNCYSIFESEVVDTVLEMDHLADLTKTNQQNQE